MARVKKYEKGPKIRTMNQLLKELEEGNYVFWFHKPQHPGWIGSMTFHTLMYALKRGALSKSRITKEWRLK